jgi:hypothetical protein
MRLLLGGRIRLIVLLAAAAAAVGSSQASAATLTVCPSGCAFSQIAPAIAAASPGDTIQVAAGTYDGGFAIDKTLQLVGAGAGSTIISGGGPVITIGTFGAASEPTVSISGVTITGGVTHSSFLAVFAGDNVIALGGGIEVPPAEDFANGATVTIANSVITGNRAAPTEAIDSTIPCPADITITCINGDLPFALAGGGGIDNWGAMTLSNTTVRDNQVGGAVASDANAGGIYGEQGSLSLDSSTVSGNQASASAPNGRFADTGGVFAEFGTTLSVENSLIGDNSASLAASMPSDVASGTAAIGGGIHIGGGVHAATIKNSTVSGNSVSMTNTIGDATAFSGGVHVDVGVHFEMSNSTVADNVVSSVALPGSTGNAGGDSGAGEILGTISNTRFTGNTVNVNSEAGDATAFAGAGIDFGSVTNSVVSNNHVHASSPSGAVFAAAGALVVDEPGLTLRNTEVSGNTVDASGASGSAQGGGIFDAPIANGPPGGPLKLLNSGVTGNALSGSPGIALQGGGLYIQNEPLRLTNSVIANNSPDQCFGC